MVTSDGPIPREIIARETLIDPAHYEPGPDLGADSALDLAVEAAKAERLGYPDDKNCWAPRNRDGSLKAFAPHPADPVEVTSERLAELLAQLREGHARAREAWVKRFSAVETAERSAARNAAQAEVQRRGVQLDARIATLRESALPYPPDGGLRPQVRTLEDTPSPLAEMARQAITQQQDPRHDQPAFTLEDLAAKVDALPPASSLADPHIGEDLPFAVGSGGSGVIAIHGVDYPLSHVRVNYAAGGEGDTPPAPLSLDDVVVTGEFQTTFVSQELWDEVCKGEVRRQKALEQKFEQALRTLGRAYGPPWKRELMWFVHNVFAHPLSEVAHWLGYLHPKIRAAGDWLHQVTVPPHAPNTGRG